MAHNIALESYQLYHSLNNHFKQKNYNFFKYKGKVNIPIQTFNKKPDRYFYYKLSKKYTNSLQEFYLSILTKFNNDKIWIGELQQQEYHDCYLEWKSRIQSLSLLLENDCQVINEIISQHNTSFKHLLISQKNQLPVIIQSERQQLISLETCVIINQLTSFSNHVETIHPSWKNMNLVLNKYYPFLGNNHDLKKFSKIIKNSIKL